jgi:SNF2 family DNA or RNA helicase
LTTIYGRITATPNEPEKIVRLLEKKRGMADQIVGAAQEGPRQWTKDELIELLKPLD